MYTTCSAIQSWGNVEKWIFKMPVRYIEGLVYIATGVDAAKEANAKFANEMGITVDQFHTLTSCPMWWDAVSRAKIQNPGIDMAALQYLAIDLLFNEPLPERRKTMGELIAEMLLSR